MYLLVFSRPGFEESAVVFAAEATQEAFNRAHDVAGVALAPSIEALELEFVGFVFPGQEKYDGLPVSPSKIKYLPVQRVFVG